MKTLRLLRHFPPGSLRQDWLLLFGIGLGQALVAVAYYFDPDASRTAGQAVSGFLGALALCMLVRYALIALFIYSNPELEDE